MKSFPDLLSFSEHLIKAATVELKAIHKGLELSGQIIQEDAKNQIGELQPATGPFPAWEELSESTQLQKERLGYGDESNDWQPLLRTGVLRDSIQYEVNMGKLEVIIGTKDPIGAFQEYGTHTIPPRPFMGPAVYKHAPQIAKIFGMVTVLGIAGGNFIASDIGRELGYHQEIKL